MTRSRSREATGPQVGCPPSSRLGRRLYPMGGVQGARRKVVRGWTADLMARARAGDGDVFRDLTEPTCA